MSAFCSPSAAWVAVLLLQDLLLNMLEKNKRLIMCVVANQQTSGFSGLGKFRLEISKRQA